VGVLFALLAFGWWGTLVPLYFWRLRAVDPVELVAHRILWGLPLLALLITARRGWRRYRDAVVDIRSLRILLGTTVLISINWFVFVYAIVTNRATEASLGYYINPLVSVALGMIVLKERLRLAQWGALLLAGGGVAYLTIASGSPPWLSLLLAFSFGFYGLLRKPSRNACGWRSGGPWFSRPGAWPTSPSPAARLPGSRCSWRSASASTACCASRCAPTRSPA